MFTNPPEVKHGDRVLDPIDGLRRTVTHVRDGAAYMEDGGCMTIAECTDILLPGEEDKKIAEAERSCREKGIRGFIDDITMVHISEWDCPVCDSFNRTEDSWPQAGEVIHCGNCGTGFEVSKTPE